MTRPTRDAVRAEPAGRRLDGWLHESMGKVVNWRYGHPFSDEVGLLGWNMVPAYSTDPAACAELRRHVIADKRWQFAQVRLYANHAAIALVPDPDVESWVEVEERGTDPIAAECVAWCKVALLAAVAPPPM